MRRAAVTVVSVCVAAAFAAAALAAAKPMRVTFVGDSVAASLAYVSTAESTLGKGLRLEFDLRVCRRLVQPSCTYHGSTPTTALQAVQGYGHALGDVLIVKVGYNESAQGYTRGIDRVMRAAIAQGARGVVWVTLRETRTIYHWTNVAIKSAARRWPQLVVADWNAYSSGRPWFGSDGLHLTTTGANALAAFLHRYVRVASR